MMLINFFDLQMTAWLTAIGYSLCYGTIVAKMFRVFYIFRNPTAKKRVRFHCSVAIPIIYIYSLLNFIDTSRLDACSHCADVHSN